MTSRVRPNVTVYTCDGGSTDRDEMSHSILTHYPSNTICGPGNRPSYLMSILQHKVSERGHCGAPEWMS